jgi:N-acetylmuramoyl-L-alanine amidase
MSRKISEIIVHCSATPAGRDVRAADINAWHKTRGFRCIGYHYVIKLDGTVERGRSESTIGAHCLGHNVNSIGVCYVGGCDADMSPCDTRTDAQKQSLLALLADLRRRYPDAKIYGHRDFAAKACPSFDATTEYSNL